MVRDIHYTLDEKQRNVLLTEDGYEAVEDILNVRDIYEPRNQWATFIINALKAKELFKPNVNYIVKDDEVIIVDEFTGRTMKGRRWSDGLHQAIEATEGVKIRQENVTVASITYQNLFRGFPKLSGMSGTAATEASEFFNIYKLEVVVVPTNLPTQRTDNPSVIFKGEDNKWNAVLSEIRSMHKLSRPLLIGTT